MDNAFSHGLTSATAALSRYLLKDHNPRAKVNSRSAAEESIAVVMNTQFTKLDWMKILLGGATALAASLLIPTIVISLYAMLLAVAGQGTPDAARLNSFANLVGGWGSQIVVALATVRAAVWVSRKAGKAAQLHGAVTGVPVALGSLIIPASYGCPFRMRDLIVMGLAIIAG